MSFSNEYRSKQLEIISSAHFDICIIGGGITGAGIALDAASRGYSVLLLEKGDFASGTSSRSTKLIHGGLRYLKQFEFLLVSQVGKERSVIHRLAPHLVVPEKMMLPFVKGGTFGRFSTALGLWLYDFLAGVKGNDRRRMFGKKATLDKEPLLNADEVLGSGIYAEYRSDDARLTIEVIKKAHQFGAVCLNYTKVGHLNYENSAISGLQVLDELSGKQYQVTSKTVVNATGPWVDHIRNFDRSKDGKHLFLTKGVHIVVPFIKFPLHQSMYFDVPDGRMIFAIPRGSITYIGTTDTEYKANQDKIAIDRADIDYLLKAVNAFFPDIALNEGDVISAWAGLRPLIHEAGKSASELSRKDEIFISASGLISIAGGKLTGYRKMAEKVVNLIGKRLKQKNIPCKTKQISLCDFAFKNYADVLSFRNNLTIQLNQYLLPEKFASYLVHLYGQAAQDILQRIDLHSDFTPEVRLILAELSYCTEREMVMTVPDFLIRRTGRLFFEPDSIPAAIEPIAIWLSKRLNWTNERLNDEIKEMRQMYEDRLKWC